MNEALIKDIIKCKLKVADTIVGSLPPSISEEVRKLGRTILEGINESMDKTKEQAASTVKGSGKLENVHIE
jgi:hypothetical protein